MLQCAQSLMMIVAGMLRENTEFCRYYLDNPDFMAAINKRVFESVYGTLLTKKLDSVETDDDIRNLIFNRLQMDNEVSDMELQREVIDKYGVRYGGMTVNDWRHIIEAYTPKVREASRSHAKEISMQPEQIGMAADERKAPMEDDDFVRVKSNGTDVEGLDKLDLIIKQVYFDAILCGDKKIEYRELKETNHNMLTRIDEKTGKRELRQPQVLKLYAGYNSDRDSMLVEVKKTLFFKPNQIEYHLGKVLEYDIKKKTADRLDRK
jgi:hypothetical protein